MCHEESVVYLKLVKGRRPKFLLNFELTAKPGLVPPPLGPLGLQVVVGASGERYKLFGAYHFVFGVVLSFSRYDLILPRGP